MEITLTPIQKHVDSAINARIFALSQAAYVKANRLPNGTMRKNHVRFTHPQEVHDLLALRQALYNGADAEGIMHQITTGEIQHATFKAKESIAA